LFSLTPLLALGQQFKIMPLGDSITHGEIGSNPLGGYRDDLANYLLVNGISFNLVGTLNDGVSVYPYHEGHPSWETRLLSKNVRNYLRARQPDIVLIHIGTNDINSDIGGAPYVMSQTSELVDSIYVYDPDIIVFVASIIPRLGEKNEQHTLLAPLLESMVERRSKAGDPIFYCPVNEMFRDNSNWERMLFDDMHPKNDGYAVIANGFFKRLTDVLTAEGPVITDNFNRHKLVGYWTSKGSYEIVNQQFHNSGNNSENYIAVYKYADDPTGLSFTYGANIDPAGSGDTGVAVRLSDETSSANGYAIIRESSSGDLVLYHVNKGALDYEIDRTPGLGITPLAGDTCTIAFLTDASQHYFDCYLNGLFDGRLADPRKVEGNYGRQRAGVLLRGTENNWLDNLDYSYAVQTPYVGPGSMVIADGQSQSGVVNSVTPKALSVQVLGVDNKPVVGTPVAFTVTTGASVAWSETSTGLAAYEAECSELTEPMMLSSATETAAGKYIFIDESGFASQATAQLQIEIAQSGNYYIWGRVKGPDINHRSVYVSLDNGAEFTWQFDYINTWHWDALGELNGNDPKIFNLTAGRHTLKIRGRETLVALDRIILTQNVAFVPANTAFGSSAFYTDAQGRASAKVILPKLVGSVEIKAFVQEFPNLSQIFNLSATAGNPALMAKLSGDLQVGKPNEPLPIPFKVSVTDAFGNPAIDAEVQFAVTAGSGNLVEPQPVRTNDQGIAEVHYLLGNDSGESTVAATCPGYISSGVVFTATAQKILFIISGQTRYYAEQRAIPEVQLNITGGMNATTASDQAGNYRLNSIPKFTDFSVAPTKAFHEANARATVDLYNAALIMRNVLGLETFSTFQQLAADVDLNGAVTSYDAANIARFIVKLPPVNSGIRVGEWIFKPGNQSYSNIQVDLGNQNYTGILLGDIQGRWTANLQNLSKEIYANYAWPGTFEAAAGDTISLPFRVDQTEILACDLYYQFNPSEVEFLDIQQTSISSNFSVFHRAEPGDLQIAMFSPYPTTQTGEFLKVRFRILSENISEQTIVFEKYRLNDQPFVVLGTGVPLKSGSVVPRGFALAQNFPNPFSAVGTRATSIFYSIPTTEPVQIAIYNLLGQQICTLVNQPHPAGNYQITWDGRDAAGNVTAAGVYIYQMRTATRQLTRKMLKLE
jgi:lysophospholipase L1-like esterase